MRTVHRFGLAAAACAASLALAGPSLAQGDDARSARLLAQQGLEALVRNDFQLAADRLARADALIHDPVIMLGLARAQAGLGKLAAARATYHRITMEDAAAGPPARKKAIEDAHREMQTLAQRLAWITIDLDAPGDSKVLLDGVLVEKSALGEMQAIDPGKHTVKVTGDGLQADETVIVTAGEERVVKLTLRRAEQAPEPPPEPPPPAAPPPPPPAHDGSAQRTLGILSLVVGGVGIGVGTVAGLMAASRQGDLAAACPRGACGPDHHATLDDYRVLGTVSTVGFVAGGVGLGLGTVLLATAPSSIQSPRSEQARAGIRVTPTVGFGAIGAAGRF